MPTDHECTVTLLTPPGRSAVAVLLIEGDGAEWRVGQLFRPASGEPFRDAVLGRILVGYLGRDADQCGEQVVVCRRGLETIEVHCHGGRAAVAMVIEQFVGLGCRQSRWEDRVGQLEQDLVTAEARLGWPASARTGPPRSCSTNTTGPYTASWQRSPAKLSPGSKPARPPPCNACSVLPASASISPNRGESSWPDRPTSARAA